MKSLTLDRMLDPARASDAALIIPRGPTLTYPALDAEVDRVARLLAGYGIQPHRPVSIVLPNGLESVVVFLAVVRVGAVAAPLAPAYTADEYKFYMDDAGAQCLILPAGEHPARTSAMQLGLGVLDVDVVDAQLQVAAGGSVLTASRNPVGPSPGDVALFLHTSGTTSRPKGVPLTHANLTVSMRNIAETYRLTPEDRSLLVMPLFHVHGLVGVALSTLCSGGTLIVPPRFSASGFWQDQQQYGATWYSAVPTIHDVLLARADQDGAPRRSFRFIRSCSSPLDAAVLPRIESRFGAPVLQAYGMTEAAHQVASNPLPPAARVAGTVGMGTGVEIAIMDVDNRGIHLPPGDEGEVIIKGPNVMGGYHNNPQANAEAFVNGWFRTGDLGSIDRNGYLTLAGRIKELINRGGEKISPAEVDAVLRQHPAVAQAVCFGMPDAKYGECVRAAVVRKQDVDADSLRSFCREHLAAFKVPDVVYFVDDLPRTASGKIERRRVAAAFQRQAAGETARPGQD